MTLENYYYNYKFEVGTENAKFQLVALDLYDTDTNEQLGETTIVEKTININDLYKNYCYGTSTYLCDNSNEEGPSLNLNKIFKY